MIKTQAFILHALSPLHVGVGHAADIIDLPIAKMKATNIPFVPGSSIKGVLRDASRNGDSSKTDAVFGPAQDPEAHAGALIVGDARLVALPVRSYRGTFAWVSSPLLLTLARRDMPGGDGLAVPEMSGRQALHSTGNVCEWKRKLYIEDLDLDSKQAPEVDAWANLLAPLVDGEMFKKRFAIIDDDTMSLLFETGTQVDTRIRLNAETRTVAKGALWLEESLPAETLLLGILASDRSRKKGVEMSPGDVLEHALPQERILQFGGKATVGRGRCRMIPLKG